MFLNFGDEFLKHFLAYSESVILDNKVDFLLCLGDIPMEVLTTIVSHTSDPDKMVGPEVQ